MQADLFNTQDVLEDARNTFFDLIAGRHVRIGQLRTRIVGKLPVGAAGLQVFAIDPLIEASPEVSCRAHHMSGIRGSQHPAHRFGALLGPHQEGFQRGALVVLLAVLARPTVPVHRDPARAWCVPPRQCEAVLERVGGGVGSEREPAERH